MSPQTPGTTRFFAVAYAMLPLGAIVLTVPVVTICISIEILNAKADYYLPHTELPQGSNSKWRWRGGEHFRERYIESILRGRDSEMADEQLSSLLADYELTLQEKERLDREIAIAEANNTLHRVVETWGLLQYPVSVLALLASLVLLSKAGWRMRTLGAVCIILNGTCIFLMLHRGYFTSLGW